MSKTADTKRNKPGPKASGITRRKVSVTVPTGLLQTAVKLASSKGESLSQFVSRAMQNLILES